MYTAIELVAVALCVARAVRRHEDRTAWLLISAGLLAWTAGDFTWTIWLDNLANPPYPSLADGFYLSLYPAMYVGLTLLMRSNFRHTGVAVWLDGLVVGATMAALGAALIFPAVLDASSGDAASVGVNLAYPFGDLLLLVFIAVGFALSGWRPGRQWLLLGAAIAVNASADMVYVYQVAKGTYVEGNILDTLWPASMALMACAAWQPRADRRARSDAARHTIVLPAISALVALALLASSSASTHPLTGLSVALATLALLAAGVRAGLTYLENVQMLKRETRGATTDALTGLGNRRQLMEDLQTTLERSRHEDATLAFFDLNGFKRYNDSFGHGAGDALLVRLGGALADAVQGRGGAYRLGGDEFCVLLAGCLSREDDRVLEIQAALAEHGSGFTVTASCGVVNLPREADKVSAALNLADERMYADKSAGGSSRARAQTVLMQQSVLMQLLTEREPSLHDHVCDVGVLATAIGRRFELNSEQLDELRRAAELHDLGKLAVPDKILYKPGPLDDSEWALMRQHTVIGERILNAAPALGPVARLVRSSHERWDGKGYPDGLAETDIPLGSRIISVCDAYDAMISERSYDSARSPEAAIAELQANAGTQFDAQVVEALCEHLKEPVTQRAPLARNAITSRSPARAPGQGRPGGAVVAPRR